MNGVVKQKQNEWESNLYNNKQTASNPLLRKLASCCCIYNINELRVYAW